MVGYSPDETTSYGIVRIWGLDKYSLSRFSRFVPDGQKTAFPTNHARVLSASSSKQIRNPLATKTKP